MAIKGAHATFEPLGFPERQWRDPNYTTRYHVYINHDERVVVTADTAAEAIRTSGVKKPYKVVRGMSSNEDRIATIQAGRLVAVEGAAEAERAAAEERRRISHEGVVPVEAFRPGAAIAAEAAGGQATESGH